MPDHVRTAVRAATRGDIAQTVRTLTRAFAGDPMNQWLFPDPAWRQRDTARYFAIYLGLNHVPHGRVDIAEVAGTVQGAAVWHPPGDTSWHATTQLRTLPHYLGLFGGRLPEVGAAVAAISRKAPQRRHWYLADLGVEPAAQGQGVASALLHAGLERADGDGVPAYLESSTKAGIALYEDFGFHLIQEIGFSNAPVLYGMLREPGAGS